MPSLTIGDVDLHYEERGRGPLLVWIPGTGLRGLTWEAQVDHFSDRYRCVTLDLRGSGETSGGGSSFTVADLAGDVAALLDALGEEQVTVAGVSLGAAVGQELTLARPDLVGRLVLVSTWSSSAREHHIRRHFESRLYALEHGPVDVYAQFAFWMSSPWLYDHEPELQAQVEARLRTHMSSTMAGTAAHFRADLAHETRDRLGQIGCPTLVVCGEDDLITLPWYNETVAAHVPMARLVTVPQAGHLIWLERPEALSLAIDQFLAEARAPVAQAAQP